MEWILTFPGPLGKKNEEEENGKSKKSQFLLNEHKLQSKAGIKNFNGFVCMCIALYAVVYTRYELNERWKKYRLQKKTNIWMIYVSHYQKKKKMFKRFRFNVTNLHLLSKFCTKAGLVTIWTYIHVFVNAVGLSGDEQLWHVNRM